MTLPIRKQQAERFLGWDDLFERGFFKSRTQGRRLWEKGQFPRPVHLSERVIGWKESEIEEWVASRPAVGEN